MLNTDKISEGLCSLEKEQDSFMQYLLQCSSECCMYSAIELTLLLSFCVGVKFVVLHLKKNILRVCKSRWWGQYLVWEGGRGRGVQKIV